MLRTLFLLPLVGACHAPVSWIVPSAALEELSRDTRPAFDEPEFASAVRARYGVAVEPVEWLEDGWRRFDGPALLSGARSGDLLLVKNPKPQALSTTIGLAEPTWFSHMGILLLDGDTESVIETWPAVRLLAKVPTFAERFEGQARVTDLADFLARYHHGLIVRPAGDANDRVTAALALVEAGVRFDPFHDPERPELSCSEFVSAAMGLEGDRAPAQIPVTDLASATRVRIALGFYVQTFVTPDCFARLPGTTIVGELGRHRDLGEVRALQALWFEVHGRSQEPGSSMGDWLRVDRFSLFGWNPRTEALLRYTVGVIRARPDEEPVELARELVDLVLASAP